MANGIKIGASSFDALKIGSADVDAAYIGDTLIYSGGTQPQTLQWVSFSAGDTVPSGDVYGIKVSGATAYPTIINNGSFYFINGSNDLNVYNGAKDRWYYDAYNCNLYEIELGFRDDDFTLMFNTICSGIDSFTVDISRTTTISYDCQLYIYA